MNSIDNPEGGAQKSPLKWKRKYGQKERRKSLMQVTDRTIDRLCSLCDNDEIMDSIDIKDLKNLTSSVKELLCLSGELNEESDSGGVVILPEVKKSGK